MDYMEATQTNQEIAFLDPPFPLTTQQYRYLTKVLQWNKKKKERGRRKKKKNFFKEKTNVPLPFFSWKKNDKKMFLPLFLFSATFPKKMIHKERKVSSTLQNFEDKHSLKCKFEWFKKFHFVIINSYLISYFNFWRSNWTSSQKI